MSIQSEIQALIQAEMDAIAGIPIDGVIEQAVDLIEEHVHRRQGKIVVSGMGKAGQIGNNIATTLASTGSPAVFIHPAEAQHGDLGVLQANDVLLVVSNSGKTREVVELVTLAERLVPNIPIITLTGNNTGTLCEVANVVLFTGGPKEICPLGLTPTTSTTVMTVVGDILVVLLMKRIGFSREEYAKRHHSGYLGQKARTHEE